LKGNHGRQPEAIAKLKGVYQPYKYPNSNQNNGLVYLTSLPNPPIKLNEIGAKFWNDILGGAIHINGYIAIHDIFMFEELCYIYQLKEAAIKDIELFGNTTLNDKGKREKSIGYILYKETLKDFYMLCKEFGLSPSSRTVIKFQTQKEEKEDILQMFSL
jgi:P27 family predicted phage terminase small subunit